MILYLLLGNFELTLDKSVLGDFNAKSSSSYNKDITSNEGRKIVKEYSR